jgi:hypothetical protein
MSRHIILPYYHIILSFHIITSYYHTILSRYRLVYDTFCTTVHSKPTYFKCFADLILRSCGKVNVYLMTFVVLIYNYNWEYLYQTTHHTLGHANINLRYKIMLKERREKIIKIKSTRTQKHKFVLWFCSSHCFGYLLFYITCV